MFAVCFGFVLLFFGPRGLFVVFLLLQFVTINRVVRFVSTILSSIRFGVVSWGGFVSIVTSVWILRQERIICYFHWLYVYVEVYISVHAVGQ